MPEWRKSSFSQDGGECVELSWVDGQAYARDSKNPDGPTIPLDLLALVGFAKVTSTPRSAGRATYRTRSAAVSTPVSWATVWPVAEAIATISGIFATRSPEMIRDRVGVDGVSWVPPAG